MSTSYIAICPANPLLPDPDLKNLILQLKKKGFIDEKNQEWKNPETGQIEIFYRAGPRYVDYISFSDEDEGDPEIDVSEAIISLKVHEEIHPEFYTFGEFKVTNPETGSELEDWARELSGFLEDNNHKWTDPLNNKSYFFFELETKNIALGRHFITIEDGSGEPNEKLIQLLKEITGQDYKWIWTII